MYLEQELGISDGNDSRALKNTYNDENGMVAREFDSRAYIQRLDDERAERVARRRAHAGGLRGIFARCVPYGGLVASGFSLTSSSIGAGIISLPSAFQMSGVVMAFVYLVVLGIFTVYSYTLLAIAGKRTGLRSYEKVVKVTMGARMDYFLAFCMWFLSFGTEVSYVISMCDIIGTFLNNSPNVPHFFTTVKAHRIITALLWLFFMYPLTLPREINSLRYFSVIAIFLMMYFVFSMVLHSILNTLRHGARDDIVYFQTGNTAVQALGIFMAAYLSQLNCYEVYDELYKPTVKRLTLTGGISASICFILYSLAGLFGYLDFGAAVTGSSLKLYNPINEPFMGVSYAIIMLKLCVGYGLNMIPVREAIYHVVRVDCKTILWWKHALIVSTMAVCSLIGGIFIPRVNTALGLVGGFSGGFISYIFPALMYMYSGHWTLQTVGWFHYFMTYLLLICGVIGVVFGTISTIYGEFNA